MEPDNAIPKHHVKQELCTSRPAYRAGRKMTSVKVYTVHQESKYLLVQNVPAVGAKDQLAKLLATYGAIEDLHALDEYPAEKFTEVYLVKFQKIQSARFAKKKLDDHSFFGGSLHICYAPEYEMVKETREKLQDRRKVIAAKVRKLEMESKSSSRVEMESSKSSSRVQTTARLSETSGGNSRSLMSSQQTSALPPPVSGFQPPPPPPPPPPPTHPPPPMTPVTVHPHTCAPSFPPATELPQISSSHRLQGSVGNGFSSQRPEAVSAGYGASDVHRHSHGGDNSDLVSDNVSFHIPPPPMPGVSFDASHYRTPHFTRNDYGFAWVPSANASFPPGYDPRLPQKDKGSGDSESEPVTESDEGKGGSHTPTSSIDKTLCSHRLQLTSIPDASSHRPASSNVAVLDPTNNVSKSSATVPGAGRSHIVVKQYKPKGPPPKFVPRQIQERQGKSVETGVPSKMSAAKEQEEAVNREIRREAFRLGKDQGPSLPSDPEVREQLLGQRPLVEPKVEASVVASVKAIRKRLSEVISETVPKQLKVSAQTQVRKTSDKDHSSAD